MTDIDLEAEDKDEIAIRILGDIFERMDRAYEIMNWFASGDSMDQWSSVLPTDILAEVYAILAPVQLRLQDFKKPEKMQHVMDWYAEEVRKERHKLQMETLEVQAAALQEIEKVKEHARKKITRVEEECKAKIYQHRLEMDNRVRKAVEKAVRKTVDKFKGKPRVAPSGRQVRL